RLHPGYITVIPVDLEYLFSRLNFVRNSQGLSAGSRRSTKRQLQVTRLRLLQHQPTWLSNNVSLEWRL
ncbi:TPA: hypothetical protein ACVWSU_001792, partial [Legionella anisa]